MALLEVGDVAGDAGEHAAVAQVQLADGQVHRKGAAVLAQADHLAADADDLLLTRSSGNSRDSRRARAGTVRA